MLDGKELIMRFMIPILVLFTSLLPVTAEPLMPGFVDWKSPPKQVLKSLQDKGIESKLNGFHKTGVPYITGKVSTLGNRWEFTVYFDEKDRPNQILLQLEDLNRSQITRIQKLAAGDYGQDFKVKNQGDETRQDTVFEWAPAFARVELTSSKYRHKEDRVAWLKFTPKR